MNFKPIIVEITQKKDIKGLKTNLKNCIPHVNTIDKIKGIEDEDCRHSLYPKKTH